MAVSYVQTDTTAITGGASTYATSFVNLDSTNFLSSASTGATAGSVEQAVAISSGSSVVREAGLWFQIAPSAGTSWDAGTWTIPIHVSSAGNQVTLQEVKILHISSANTQLAQLGSTEPAADVGTTGTITATITGSSATPGTSDTVVIVGGFIMTNSMVSRAFGITPDQTISSPFTTAAGGITIPTAMYQYKKRRAF